MLNTSDLIQKITRAEKIILTTHKNCDGDGLGSVVALYWGLKQLQKNVTFYHVDEIPSRYSYLLPDVEKKLFDSAAAHQVEGQKINCDLLLVLDTNHGALCNPLFDFIARQKTEIIFVDHHQEQSFQHTNVLCFNYIQKNAASTGEIIFDLLKILKVTIETRMAEALYSSLTFDTQAFKLVKNTERSHQIAAELATFPIKTDEIQRHLFANWTVDKMIFLSYLIQSVSFSQNNKVAGFKIKLSELEKYHLSGDDVNDILDLFTLIKSVEFCYCIKEISENSYKLSFRSVQKNYSFLIADEFGGGGHNTSAGAWVNDTAENIEKKIQDFIQRIFKS